MLETISIILVMFISMALGAVLMHLWDHRYIKTDESDNDTTDKRVDKSTINELVKIIEEYVKEDEAE